MKTASFAFTTPNLGDDLQVMATVRHLPRVDLLVDRDFMAEHRYDEPHAVVMNSWFQLGRRHTTFPWLRRGRLAPSPDYRPIFHGFCLGSDKILAKGWDGYLRAHGPVGCRDLGSVEKLGSFGAEAYWSGCLTLTLGMGLPPVPASERRGVYIVDLPPAVEKAFVPERIARDAIRLSNETPAPMTGDPLARMHRIAAICDRLRHAELVITRRLHTALPCVGFGTPVVVFLEDKPNNRRRFSGYDEFLPVTFWRDGVADKPRRIDWDDRTPAVVPPVLEAALETFFGKVSAQLGERVERPYSGMAQRSRIVLPNPGLGERPGAVAIDLGRARVVREPALWTDRDIHVDLDHFAGFDRFDTPVMARAAAGAEWVSVGPVSQFLRGAS